VGPRADEELISQTSCNYIPQRFNELVLVIFEYGDLNRHSPFPEELITMRGTKGVSTPVSL